MKRALVLLVLLGGLVIPLATEAKPVSDPPCSCSTCLSIGARNFCYWQEMGRTVICAYYRSVNHCPG